jgi:hypothetical protein
MAKRRWVVNGVVRVVECTGRGHERRGPLRRPALSRLGTARHYTNLRFRHNLLAEIGARAALPLTRPSPVRHRPNRAADTSRAARRWRMGTRAGLAVHTRCAIPDDIGPPEG